MVEVVDTVISLAVPLYTRGGCSFVVHVSFFTVFLCMSLFYFSIVCLGISKAKNLHGNFDGGGGGGSNDNHNDLC